MCSAVKVHQSVTTTDHSFVKEKNHEAPVSTHIH